MLFHRRFRKIHTNSIKYFILSVLPVSSHFFRLPLYYGQMIDEKGVRHMKLTLAENIRSFRKQRSLTQEQLAEILGVTTGAVYKWESGLSVPELNLIVEMADFFDVSVDNLLGYKMKDNRLEATLDRISQLCRTRDPEALTEAEKAVKKYPNSFELVHACAEVYLAYGAGSHDKKELRRALELLEQSRLLLVQNTEPRISEATICGEMASAYIFSGEAEKGIELLKEHNAGGIYNDAIGLSLILYLNRPKEAEPFLTDALLSGVGTLIDAVTGYTNIICLRGDYSLAREMVTWGIDLLRGIMKKDSLNFFDKTYACLLVMLAYTQLQTGEKEAAQASVRKAAGLVKRFDETPDYGLDSLRFINLSKDIVCFDALGATAAESIETIIRMTGSQTLSAMWKEEANNG